MKKCRQCIHILNFIYIYIYIYIKMRNWVTQRHWLCVYAILSWSWQPICFIYISIYIGLDINALKRTRTSIVKYRAVYINSNIHKDVFCWSKERIRIYFKIRRSTKGFVCLEFIYFVLTYVLCVCFQLLAFVREYMWHKALLMGYSMRLELNLVSSLNDFQSVLYRSYSSFFLEGVYFGLLYSSLIFDMFIVVCMCVCACVSVGVVWGFANNYFSSPGVCECVSRGF